MMMVIYGDDGHDRDSADTQKVQDIPHNPVVEVRGRVFSWHCQSSNPSTMFSVHRFARSDTPSG